MIRNKITNECQIVRLLKAHHDVQHVYETHSTRSD